MAGCEALTDFDETSEENAYVRYFTGEKLPTVKREPSYCFDESAEPGYLEFVTGLMEAYEVKEKSRKRGLTVTEYFCAAMILAVIRSAKKPIDDAVTIAVPVNMRNSFRLKRFGTFRQISRSYFIRTAEMILRSTRLRRTSKDS